MSVSKTTIPFCNNHLHECCAISKSNQIINILRLSEIILCSSHLNSYKYNFILQNTIKFIMVVVLMLLSRLRPNYCEICQIYHIETL